MLGVLVQLDGWDPVAGAAVTLFAGSHDAPEVCHLVGQEAPVWWPALAKLPTLRYDLFDGAFTGAITAPSSTLTLRTEPWPNFGRYALADARLRLWTGEVGDAWGAWTLRFDGRVTEQPKSVDGAANLSFAVDDRWLDAALLPTYAGTTGAEGGADLKGVVKPLALGAPRYVPGTLVDVINSVFQVSAFGFHAIEAALEKLTRFGASKGDYGTFAALVAATLPPGSWATCKAGGFVRFGAPPSGQISFLVQGDEAGTEGWIRKPGAIIRRLAQLSSKDGGGGPVTQPRYWDDAAVWDDSASWSDTRTFTSGSSRVDDVSIAALDAARPYNVSIYLDQQTTAREVIQQLAASLNCVAGVSWTGQLFVVPVALAAPSVTLAADGSALPPVRSIEQIETAAPWQKLAITAERAWVVHALSDIAFTAPLIEVGAYSATTVYREGNIVTLPDGSRWLYIATVPSAGVTPVEGTTWTSLSAASVSDWKDITDTTGTKPADNADVTGDNTSKDTNAVGGKPASEVLDEIAASSARQDVLEQQIIPSITDAAAAAGERIDTAQVLADLAKTRADLALSTIGTETTRLDERIDTVSASGGYDDTAVKAEVSRVDSAALRRDAALGERVDTVSASIQTTDTDLRALVSTKESAAVDREDAISQRVDTLIAQGGGGSANDPVARSEVQRVEQASIGRDTALGTRVDNVSAAIGTAVNAKAQELTTAFTDADTALAQRATTLEVTARPGGNLIPNSALSTLDGWTFGDVAGGGSMSKNFPDSNWMLGGVENNLCLYQPLDKGDGEYSEATSPAFAVTPGSTIQFYAYAMSHRANHWVSVVFFNAAGSFFAYGGEHLGLRANEGGRDPNAWEITGAQAFMVPAGAVKAQMLVRQYGFTRQADRYSWFSRPFVGEVQPGRNTWVPYSPGNDRPVTGAQSARLSTVETATTDGRFATAQRAGIIETTVDNAVGRISATETATTDGRFASASTVTQLRSEYDGTAATVSQQAGTITGLGQKTAAYVRVTADAGNGIAQLSLWSDAYGGNWELTGNGRVSGNLVVDGTIFTNKIAGNAITTTTYAAFASPVGRVGMRDNNGGDWITIASATAAGAADGSILVTPSADYQGVAYYVAELKFRILRDGAVIYGPVSVSMTPSDFETTTWDGASGSGTYYRCDGIFNTVVVDVPGVGNHTYELQIAGSYSAITWKTNYRVMVLTLLKK